MNDLRKNRIAYLQRKMNGNMLKPVLLEKSSDQFGSKLGSLIDQDTSYMLFNRFESLSSSPKILSLNGVPREKIMDALNSLDKNDWGEKGYLFLHHFLDVGSFEVELKFVSSNLFNLVQGLDSDAISYLDKNNKHGIYFDYSENNLNPNDCFYLDIW